MRTTIFLDNDTERRLNRYAKRLRITNRSEAIRLAIHEAERGLDIKEILRLTGNFQLRYSNEQIEGMENRGGKRPRPR